MKTFIAELLAKLKALGAKIKTKLGFAVVGVAVASLAYGAAFYVGFNPLTNMNGQQGIPVSVGTPPPVTGTCGTIGAVTGGSAVFQVQTAAVTTCTLIVTIPAASAAPTGLYCVFTDETSPAHPITQASHSTTTCSSNAATIVASDVILVEVNAY